MFMIEMLPARYGDCLWLEYGTKERPHRVLIDGGPPHGYQAFKARIAALPENERRFELLVITHVDADHIGGILELLIDPPAGVTFGDVWFNAWDQLPGASADVLGAVQGEQVSALLKKRKWTWNKAFQDEQRVCTVAEGRLPTKELASGLKLTLIGPTFEALERLRPKWKEECEAAGIVAGSPEEALEKLWERREQPPDLLGGEIDPRKLAQYVPERDPSLANGSSISLLAEFEGRSCLLTGDSHADALTSGLHRLKTERGVGRLPVDAFKISHHGSKNNTNDEAYRHMRCSRYLFSSDGSQKSGHPHRESVAKAIIHGGAEPTLYFNYRTEKNEGWDDASLKRSYGYKAAFPDDGDAGLKVVLQK